MAGDCKPPDLFLCLEDCGVLGVGPLANDCVVLGVEGPRPNSILNRSEKLEYYNWNIITSQAAPNTLGGQVLKRGHHAWHAGIRHN